MGACPAGISPAPMSGHSDNQQILVEWVAECMVWYRAGLMEFTCSYKFCKVIIKSYFKPYKPRMYEILI